MDAPPVAVAPSRRRFEEDLMLDVALELFSTTGYNEVPMAMLAERAGTTKPTLYARLGGKEQIYLRVLEREAERLTETLYEAYEQAMTRPLDEMVTISMLAFFRFAQRRRAGFELLFRGEPGGPGQDIGDRAVNEVIGRVTEMIAGRRTGSGRRPGPSAALLAAASVGVARQLCEYAHDHDLDFELAGELGAGYALAALRGLPVELIERIDQGSGGRSGPARSGANITFRSERDG